MRTDPEDPESVQRLAPTAAEQRAYLKEFITFRRSHPEDDLISKLEVAEIDGERLNDEEVTTFSSLLLLAGHITTSVLLGNIFLCLDGRPGLLKVLREDRSRITGCIEETLRLRPPFTKIERVAVTDTEIAGERFAGGTHLHLWLLSANRDPRAFDEPGQFWLERGSSRHLAFGRGIHY